MLAVVAGLGNKKQAWFGCSLSYVDDGSVEPFWGTTTQVKWQGGIVYEVLDAIAAQRRDVGA